LILFRAPPPYRAPPKYDIWILNYNGEHFVVGFGGGRVAYRVHVLLGLFWPLAAGSAQLPKILSQGLAYRTGFISVFYVGGMIVIGILLFIVSILALKAGRSE
jgi:hypothetical protein